MRNKHRHPLEILAGQLRSLRADKGLTQERLAALAGVNRVTIARIESQSVEGVTLATLTALASALRVSLPALLSAPEGEGGR